MRQIILITILGLFLFGCTKKESLETNEENKNHKTIKISSGKIVWFNPSNGKTIPGGNSPKIQNNQYMIWIESNDPEFDFDKDWWGEFGETYGLKYIGSGKKNFNEKEMARRIAEANYPLEQDLLYQSGRYGRKEDLEKMAAENAIFYISAPDGDCIIMITKFYPFYKEDRDRKEGPTPREWNLEFEWKKIEDEGA